jgi:hypothetical protein
MRLPKWYVIARNEYRIVTSGIRQIRPFFLPMLIIILVIFIGLIAPMIVEPIFRLFDVPAFFVSIAAVAMMQILLFMFFIWFLLIPITYTLKEEKAEQLEIFLSAPVKPSDLLLGKFLGQLPFYAIAIALIAGFFTAFLTPLGLDVFQITMIILIIILTLVSAEWIGTVIAALLKSKLSKSARGRDIGKGLSLIIALPMIALMYAIMGGGLTKALADPNTSDSVKMVLGIFPSSWGAELLVDFALHPSDIGSIWYETLTRFGGLVLFFVGSLWVGAKLADRAYSLETISFAGTSAKTDGVFYNTINRIGGGRSFGTLLKTVFKDYGRRLENLSKIIYIMGIMVLINLFFVDPEDPIEALIMGIFVFPMLAAFVVGEVTLRGKEALFVYRKAPAGVTRLIIARLVHGWLFAVPIAIVIIAISLARVPDILPETHLAYTGFIALMVAANVAFALGYSLRFPAYTEKESILNLMVVSMFTFFTFMFCLILLGEKLGLLSLLVISWLIGVVFLFIGKRNLNSIE